MIRLPEDISQTLAAGGALVTPSGQRAEALRLAYAVSALAAGRRVWSTPDVLPLDAWLAREVARHGASDAALPRLLSPAEDWLLWREVTAALTADLDLMARAPLAESLRRADRLAFEFDIDFTRFRGAGAEQALLAQAAHRVRERQREWRASTAARLAAAMPQLGNERPVMFAGFASRTPQLEALIAARLTKGWDTRWREVDGGIEVERKGRVVIAADIADELERIAGWCYERLQRQPDARLLVVLPGAPEVRERLTALIRQAIDPRSVMYDGATPEALAVVEGGDPLSRRPMAAHALQSLAVLQRGADFETVSEWLRSPYWRTPDFAARCRLDLLLRRRASLDLGVPELRAFLSTVAASHSATAQVLSARLLEAAEKLGFGAATPREWSTRFHAALDALGWPGENARNSAEQQTCERFFDLLKEFGSMTPALGSVSRDTAIQWFNELAGRTSFRPASGDAPITVSPVLADPVVRYDGIWVAGLHGEAWPQPVQPDPFLPLREQIAAGVPAASAAGRLLAARALMRAWSRSTDELVLSAPARAQDMELLPSPLLKSYPLEQASAPTAFWLPQRMHREGALETFSDPVGQPWAAETPLPSGTRSLELQNDCPFRAYAELRLGAAPADAPEPGIAADVRGRLLHLALEKLWSQLRNSNELALLSEEACDAIVTDCVDRAAIEIWRMQPASPALARERRRTRRLIGALCRLERERAPFQVKHTELESRLVLGEAQLRVRIDRLDVLADRGLVILDYKSGRRTMADWYGERPSHVQLLAYQAAVGEGVRAMATVNVTAREVRFDGIAAATELLPKVACVEPSDAWERQRGDWLMRMKQLADQFLKGYAAVDPKPHACDYCHLMSLCRIGEITLAAQEAATDD